MAKKNLQEAEKVYEEETLEEIEESDNVFTVLYGYKDPEGVLHSEVEIREMTGEDEEDIAKADTRTNIGKIVTKILANCVLRIGDFTKEGTSKDKWEKIMRDLHLGDRDYILMKISELTYGKEMDFDTRCPVCGQEVKVIFETDEIEVLPIKCDPDKIPFTLEKGYKQGDRTYKEGIMRLPTGFDQEQLDKQARQNPGLANTMLITRCITEFGDVQVSSRVFRKLSLKDRKYLINLLAENIYGPKFEVDTLCEVCGSEFKAGVNPVNFI